MIVTRIRHMIQKGSDTDMAVYWGEKRYHSLDYHLRNTYGEKLYRLSLNGGMTCPNRDGSIGERGCIFCSRGGSGDFAASSCLDIPEQIRQAIESEYIDFKGLHFHVGSQLFDNRPYLQALEVILELVKKIREKFGVEVSELNFGGGFGIRYTDEERRPYAYFLDPMMERLEQFCREESFPHPAVVIEPGRSVVGEAGISVYTIGQIKDIKGVRKYVSVDGGMTDNIRPALYQSVYSGVIANKADEEKTETVTVCGKCCESGDILIKDIKTAAPKTGDILAIFTTGAYGYSMASNYNKNPKPAVVMTDQGKEKVIVKRQSYEEIIEDEI